MPAVFLRYPRFTLGVSVPDSILPAFQDNFAGAIIEPPASNVDAYFTLEHEDDPSGSFFALEESIENAVIDRLDGWIGFHAGAAVCGDAAIVVAGRPDTGKTTSMFQLAELGLDLLSEEVTPIDPATALVHPFPEVLTLSRKYVEQFVACFPVAHGALRYHGEAMARYTPHHFHPRAERLGTIVLPRYDPSAPPLLERVPPSRVLTDVLQYCFAPSNGDERLFDDVIRILQACRIYTMRTPDVGSARRLLADVVRLATAT